MADTRIVYGATCAWWGKIQEASSTPNGLPCCPHCGGVLLEVDSEEKWWAGARDFEKAHAGYVDFLEWSRGKCFANFPSALHAYLEETGKTVVGA